MESGRGSQHRVLRKDISEATGNKTVKKTYNVIGLQKQTLYWLSAIGNRRLENTLDLSYRHARKGLSMLQGTEV